ncbi:uncharacterized protein LOC129905620 [Episyrphus balteatus]|uniref:uncharacterized protein LOC129905620 n=1 Tax=Episyrphus balteatus TaxID=286459 RepID=UPI002485C14A|nr:uncharacterized protein LOC129905620 [Episyrphus balteatus]
MVSVQNSSIAVIIALIGCFVLSADAIRCHLCNSHLDEDCNSLRLTVPRGVRDEQYLTECEEREDATRVFCRKTVTNILVNEEKRIVRGCGWHAEDLRGRNDTCITADNEGFFEEICACFTDGCNSAPMGVRANVQMAFGISILMLIVATVRSG